MKWRLRFAAPAAVLLCAIGGRAELARWIQNIPSPSQLEAAFFRAVDAPAGTVELRRPPQEAAAELTKLISAAPSQAELYALRAREEEQQLDFTAAENDWKKTTPLDLADFYHRRLRSRDEITALTAAAKAPSRAGEGLTPAPQQPSWKAFERVLAVVSDQLLPDDVAANAYRDWIARYPQERAVYERFFSYLAGKKRFGDAEKLIGDYRKAFPGDASYPIEATATLAYRRGSLDEAIRIYDQSFRPLWTPQLVKSYFDLLKEAHGLRKYLEQARGRVIANPTDLNAAARIYYYYQQQGNPAAAQRALLEYRLRKDSRKSAWTPEESLTLGQLFEGVLSYDDAARSYYAAYSAPGANAASQEAALAGIAKLLLGAPEAPIAFGAGDLSMLRDIGQMDPYPGFLNGILSLILNSSQPEYKYSTENAASAAYFHRAKAAELIDLFDSRFAASSERPELHARLIEAYATYGDNDGVIRAGGAFLAAFPAAGQRSRVALAMADAYARKDQPREEFAIYNDLLKELAANADGVPIGGAPAQSTAEPANQPGEAQPSAAPARSPEYARVLDRYISRLVSLKRLQDALALYRREIDRNPGDPGLYERLAAFLDQNNMSAEVEQVYRRAMAQFPDPAWSHKLARWYLRRKQNAQFEQLTRDVVKIFSGTELEGYLRAATTGQTLAPVLYRQVNLYAHQRFPRDLAFVRNLLTAYSQRATANAAASEALLRRYWFYAPDLRDRFFERLSSSKRLDAELAGLKTSAPANPAVQQMLAEGQAWQSHFEAAAPLLQAVAAQYPADADLGTRAASLFRSLATYDAPADLKNTQVAAGIEENLSRSEPRDRAVLTRLGEIYADREAFERARPYWNRIAGIEPGKPDGYVEAATVFWDYFRFDDALRLLGEGRQKLSNPALFAYEAGAIHENRHEYRAAIEEYSKGALAGGEGNQARFRLIELARRTRDRSLIEEITTKAAGAADPPVAAVSLRADILSVQSRRPELEQFLLGVADRATSPELLAYVEQIATNQGFERVQEHGLQREIAVTTDPVDRMRQRLSLARFYEGRNNATAATRVIGDLYKDNPAILGVVRATVDFYWRNKNADAAIDVLVKASEAGQAGYKKQFAFEAARKATDAGQYDRARTMLASLLKDDPFQSEYMAAMGDAYSRQGNDRGLRDFYTQKLQQLRDAPLSPADRNEKVAALRRGLIPVLTRLQDYQGAVDQYIEVINRYPEDDGLVKEGALYATDHGRGQQLRDYYTKTAGASPKDFRWPMVLARIDTQLEDFPAAIAAYTRAAEIRPDRVDLYTARASLEERLLRFDEAAATYTKLYELSYHNSQWMEKVAWTRARQGRNAEAIQALRGALIEGRPQRPEIFFAMAATLEDWVLLPEAREYAERGVALAGNNVLIDYPDGAQLYARLMTRQRAYKEAYDKLIALVPKQPAPDTPVPDVSGILRYIGLTAGLYFTPEEKMQFAAFANAELGRPTAEKIPRLMLLVEPAGAALADVEAKWRYDLLAAAPGQPPHALQMLQEQRLRYDEFAGQLEAYWKAYPPDQSNRNELLNQAAENYRLAGSTTAELRVLNQLDQMGALGGPALTRFADLLAARTPQRLLELAGSDRSSSVRTGITSYLVESGPAARALDAITARGRGLPPVWSKAYTGLVGLYYASPSPQVNAAFRDALGTTTIGERIGKPVDRGAQFAGEGWFYYGTSYGEYLGATKQKDPDDYLPAILEATPGHADAYFKLAEYYRETGQASRAAADYGNTLQLDGMRADVHDRLALLAWQHGKRDEAIREWNTALEVFGKQQDLRRMPADFWQSLRATLEDIGQHSVLEGVRPAADRVLRTYIRRNGTYQAEPLLRGALAAAVDSAAGVSWILDLSRAAADPAVLLNWLAKSEWIPESQRAVVYRTMIQSAQAKVAAAYGEARSYAESELWNSHIEWAEYLVSHKQPKEAGEALAAIPGETRQTKLGQIVPLEVRIAAQSQGLKQLLERYAKTPDSMPSFEILTRAADDLRANSDAASARQLLEFVYTRQLDSHIFSGSTFLGLAEIRLEQGDLNSAMALLRRMTLVAGEPFENLSGAGALLTRTGHPSEAHEFLSARVRALPWDQPAQAQFGHLLVAAGKDRDQGLRMLRSLAGGSEVLYEARVAAARFVREAQAGPLTTTSSELNLLSAAAVPPADAEKPYFYAARVDSAKQSTDAAAKVRLLAGAIAIEPNHAADKLDLFRAAYQAKRYRTAATALRPLMMATLPEIERQPISPGEEGGDDFSRKYLADGFLGSTALETNARAEIARQLADCYVKLNQPAAGETLYWIAQQIQPSDPQAARDLKTLRAQLERKRQNDRRRPVITENLEQDHMVLPRIASARAQGGAQ